MKIPNKILGAAILLLLMGGMVIAVGTVYAPTLTLKSTTGAVNIMGNNDVDDYIAVTTATNKVSLSSVGGPLYITASNNITRITSSDILVGTASSMVNFNLGEAGGTDNSIYPETDNLIDLGLSAAAWKDIYYEGTLTDTSPADFETELNTKNLKPLDFHITRDENTLNPDYSPESVIKEIDGEIAIDVGEAGVASLLMIGQLKEELCQYDSRYSWCSGNTVKLTDKRTLTPQQI